MKDIPNSGPIPAVSISVTSRQSKLNLDLKVDSEKQIIFGMENKGSRSMRYLMVAVYLSLSPKERSPSLAVFTKFRHTIILSTMSQRFG